MAARGSRCSRFCSSKKFSLNYAETIKGLNNRKVYIKNVEKVNSLIENIIFGGKDQLQVISDFGSTLTKHHNNGAPEINTIGVFFSCPSISPRYIQEMKALKTKYYPIEVNPDIPNEKKKIVLDKWWAEMNALLKGETVQNEEIIEVVNKQRPSLRDGTAQLIHDLNKANIPVLVFSAGIGDCISAILKHSKILLPNVKVLSNFLHYDERGIIQGYKNFPLIHVFNKHECPIQGLDYLNSIKDRRNVILMGDSVADSTMTDGVDHFENILKIGFLYNQVGLSNSSESENKTMAFYCGENLQRLMDAFDIVLDDDQTMNVPQVIFNNIINCKER